MVHGASPVAPEHAGSVGIVHHHDAPVLFGQCDKLREWGDVPVHRKDAGGDQELAALAAFELLQSFFAGLDVLVGKDFDLGAGEPAAVDDGGVVELVGDNHVVASEDGLNRAGVGRKTGLKDDRSEEHTSELQSRLHLVCRLLLEKKKIQPRNQLAKYVCGASQTGRLSLASSC